MPRKKLPKGEKKKKIEVWIEEKYLESQNLDELRLMVYESIKKHVEHALDKNNS